MGSRKHISRKDISASAFTPKPNPNMLQTRGLSNGKKLRSTELPTTADIFRTRPFATPVQKSSGEEKQPPTPEVIEKAAAFGYKGVNIPVFAPPPAPPIQTKLTIGEPGDKYEQEADAVAARVVEQINAPATAQSTQGQSVQREAEEETEEVQAKPEISALQRMEEPLEEEIQGKFIQKEEEANARGETTTDLESAINSARGGGQPLEEGLQQSMGQAMGADFSGVRVHTDGQADELNQSIQAKAFTTGQDVFFREGAYQPGSRGGQELIAHELTHVVQQRGGMVYRAPADDVLIQAGFWDLIPTFLGGNWDWSIYLPGTREERQPPEQPPAPQATESGSEKAQPSRKKKRKSRKSKSSSEEVRPNATGCAEAPRDGEPEEAQPDSRSAPAAFTDSESWDEVRPNATGCAEAPPDGESEESDASSAPAASTDSKGGGKKPKPKKAATHGNGFSVVKPGKGAHLSEDAKQKQRERRCEKNTTLKAFQKIIPTDLSKWLYKRPQDGTRTQSGTGSASAHDKEEEAKRALKQMNVKLALECLTEAINHREKLQKDYKDEKSAQYQNHQKAIVFLKARIDDITKLESGSTK